MRTILDNREIFLTIVQHADIQALIRLHYFAPTKFKDPFILRAIAEANEIPYQIIVAEKDRREIITLIQSFNQLIASMNLRTEEGLSSTCLSNRHVMEIAIYEQDPKLFQMLMSRGYNGFDGYSQKLIGKTGNVKLIEAAWPFIRKTGRFYSNFLAGLATSHHNDLFYHYFDLMQENDCYEVIYQEAAMGDNLVILRFLETSDLPVPVDDYLVYVGQGDSQRILDDLMTRMDFDEEMYVNLMNGYLGGGHVEKAKGIHPMIKNLKELKFGLIDAIESGSVETLIYAEELQRQIFGHGFLFLQVREISFHGVWNESVRYYLDHHPHWRKAFMLNGLILNGKLEDLIEYIHMYDQKLIYTQEYLRYSLRDGNKCFLNWLIDKIGSTVADNLLASIESIDVGELWAKMNSFRGKTILTPTESSNLDDIMRRYSEEVQVSKLAWTEHDEFLKTIKLVSVADLVKNH
ncbi:Hypothetical protein POVR1_LOCUS401 [uncultured virus]|nr:Hypothetical protein POVR1_LOCUS401 [uncultured virus]